MSESTAWTCPECGTEHEGRDAEVRGGCMTCVDVLRFIEYEAPGLGMVENDVAAVVCFNDDCESTVAVDPATLVVEDDDAVDIESEEFDHETGETTGRTRVEIYCSIECRNEKYGKNPAELRTDGGTSSSDSEQCERCEERPADPDIAPNTDPDLCQQCVGEIMREFAREGERGQGQRPIGEQRALDRAERCGSGWPR